MNEGALVADRGPNMIIRILWFLLVGWWLAGLVSAVAWALNVIIIGLPLGLWMINRLPSMATLRPQEQRWTIENGQIVRAVHQQGFLIRAIYFILTGWWLSGLWMAVAYVALITVIGIPIAFWMYGRVGAVTTLYRS